MGWRGAALFLLRRMAAAVLLIAVISFAVFSLVHISPGSAEQAILGPQSLSSPEQLRQLRAEHHLDEPMLVQYWLWAKDAVRLDFGDSIQTTLPVTDEMRTRFGTSVFLGLYAYILTVTFGVVLGICAALRKRSLLDRGIIALSIVGTSAPAFATGLLLLYVFAILVPLFPTFGQGEGADFVDTLWHLTLPAVALAVTSTALLVKHTRAAVINVLDQDYVTFARARGMPRGRVLFHYALRNALIPVVTISALILAQLIVGAVLVEMTFSLPGIGSLLVQAVTTKDMPMVQGLIMVIAVVIIAVNLIADFAYTIVDPRIRLGGGPS